MTGESETWVVRSIAGVMTVTTSFKWFKAADLASCICVAMAVATLSRFLVMLRATAPNPLFHR